MIKKIAQIDEKTMLGKLKTVCAENQVLYTQFSEMKKQNRIEQNFVIGLYVIFAGCNKENPEDNDAGSLQY